LSVVSIKKQIATKDNAHDAVNGLQLELISVMTQISASIGMQLQLVQNVSIGTTALPVAHGLNRIPQGFIVVNKTATFDVYRDAAATNPDPNRFIMLRTSSGSGDQTVSILFF